MTLRHLVLRKPKPDIPVYSKEQLINSTGLTHVEQHGHVCLDVTGEEFTPNVGQTYT